MVVEDCSDREMKGHHEEYGTANVVIGILTSPRIPDLGHKSDRKHARLVKDCKCKLHAS